VLVALAWQARWDWEGAQGRWPEGSGEKDDYFGGFALLLGRVAIPFGEDKNRGGEKGGGADIPFLEANLMFNRSQTDETTEIVCFS